MENVNHLFLFKGKSQTKTSRLPKCVLPSRTSATPQIGLFPITSLLFYTVQTLAAPSVRAVADMRRRLVCKSPLSSCPPGYALNVWHMKHTVCQGDREHWKGRALGTASPCYRAVPLLKDILKLSSLPVLCWFPMATSPLISHCNLVLIYTWALWLVPYICQEALC